MLMAVIVTILVYSFILTVAAFYKDYSGYFVLDTIDVVLAGPCMWIVLLVLFLLNPYLRKINRKWTYKPQSQKDIQKIVKKIVSLYDKKRNDGDVFDFFCMLSNEYGDIFGWEDLEIKSPKYERVNKAFSRLMFYQQKETIEELSKYFEKISDKDVIKSWNLIDGHEYYVRKTGSEEKSDGKKHD